MSTPTTKRWFIEQRSCSGQARFLKGIQDSQLTYTSERRAAMSFVCKEHAEVALHTFQRHLLLPADITVEAVELDVDVKAAVKPEEGGWVIAREIALSDGVKVLKFFNEIRCFTFLAEIAMRFSRRRDVEMMIRLFRDLGHHDLREWCDAKPVLLCPITPEQDCEEPHGKASR